MTPTAIVTAGDDPFVDPAVYGQTVLPPAVHLHVEPTGGHVGYVAAAEPGRRGWTRWLDGALAHYASELLR